jgi:hypothetical protein
MKKSVKTISDKTVLGCDNKQGMFVALVRTDRSVDRQTDYYILNSFGYLNLFNL